MIFKDAAPFLAEAAESVLAQTYEPVELLLVDDGGSDGATSSRRRSPLLRRPACGSSRTPVERTAG